MPPSERRPQNDTVRNAIHRETRTSSQIDRSEMPLDTWRRAIDEKINEHDAAIAAWVSGERFRDAEATRRFSDALDAATASISAMQKEGATKIDRILEETKKQTGMLDASATEREARKQREASKETREVRKYRAALLAVLVPVLLALIGFAAGLYGIRTGTDVTAAPESQHRPE